MVIQFFKWLFSPGKWFKKKAKPVPTPVETESIWRGTRTMKKQGNLIPWEMDQNTGIVQRAPVHDGNLRANESKIYIWSLNKRNAIRNLQNQGFKPVDDTKNDNPRFRK
jgi:hypothetical protein